MQPNLRGEAVEERITGVGRDLARAFGGVLEAIPGSPHRPQWLARTLGVNTVLTSRILKMARQEDPLAVAYLIPGPEPLRRVLRAAERKKVDAGLIRDARAAVDRFEELIDAEAGDRSALDAIISGWLPEAREKVELLAKQSVFRGMGQLLGAACDVTHLAAFIHPSGSAGRDALRGDTVWLEVRRGLRRLRPNLPVKFDMHSSARMLSVSGRPADGPEGLLLEEFCSSPRPALRVEHLPGKMRCTLAGDDVGVRSAVDLAYATLLPDGREVWRGAGEAPRRTTLSVGIAIPTRLVIVDVVVHEGIFPAQQPMLYLYQTLADGVADPDDPRRAGDRLDVMESVQPLGRDIATFRAAETPRYAEMLRRICAERGWDGREFRGYRCRIEYPIYSTQVLLAFELPEVRGT